MRILLTLTLLALAGTTSAAGKPKSATKKPDPIAIAHERVKDALKDPDSARFRNEFVGKDGAVCGFVNSKNSYGGYGGFENYIVTSEQVIMGGEAWKMESRWDSLCAGFDPGPK